MGLFDFLSSEDPNQQAQLALAAGLLGGRGSFNQILGQALTQGQRAGAAAGAIKRQADLDRLAKQRFELALSEEERRKKQEAGLEALRAKLPSPETLAVRGAFPDGNISPTKENAAKIPAIDPLTMFTYEAAKTPGGLNPMDYIRSQQPDTKPLIVGKDQRVFQGGKEIIPAVGGDDKDIARLKRIYGEGTPEYVAALQRLGTKMTTHTPPMSVSYGAPVSGVDEKGNPVFFQPGKTGGAPSIVPGVRPPDPNAKPPTEFEAKAGLYFKSMTNASTVLDEIEKTSAWRPGVIESTVPNEEARTLARPEARQKYLQAQRQWIDSINRVRSGANLPEIEYDRAVRTFFPTFGEGEAIKKQKAEMRKKEEQAMKEAAGRAVKPAGVPQGIDKALWDHMTPEERALWRN